MTQKYADVLNRIQTDCETMQIHGGECFATKLLDLAVAFYVESAIKSKCFAYLIATDQMVKYHETTEAELMQAITDSITANE